MGLLRRSRENNAKRKKTERQGSGDKKDPQHPVTNYAREETGKTAWNIEELMSEQQVGE